MNLNDIIDNCKVYILPTYVNDSVYTDTEAYSYITNVLSTDSPDRIMLHRISEQDKEEICYGKKYPLNEHHFTTKYVNNIILPELCNFIDVPFNKSEFDIISYYDNINGNNFDLSYLKHKINNIFNIKNYTFNIIEENTELFSENKNKFDESSQTKYHRLFHGTHNVSEIENVNLISDSNLIISCDSQIASIIHGIAPYFKNMLILDKREYFNNKIKVDTILNRIKFNQILLLFFRFNGVSVKQQWEQISKKNIS